MDCTQQMYVLPFVPGTEAVTMHIVGSSGLGYYIDPALPQEQQSISVIVNGTPMLLTRTWADDHLDRYAPTHLQSGYSFGVFFHKEEHAKSFIEQMSLHLDWTCPLEELVEHPLWPDMGRITHETAIDVIG